jgi:hypothetical protein
LETTNSRASAEGPFGDVPADLFGVAGDTTNLGRRGRGMTSLSGYGYGLYMYISYFGLYMG